MKKMPRWQLIAGSGLVVLVVPLIVALLTAPKSAAEKDPATETDSIDLSKIEMTEEDKGQVDAVVERIRNGEIAIAAAEFTDSLGRKFPVAGYPRLLNALKPQLRDNPTRRTLQLYADVLAAIINERVEIHDLEFHVRSLRYLALALGDRDLLDEVADTVYTVERLPRAYSKVNASFRGQLDVATYYIVFERWRPALEVLTRLDDPELVARQTLETRLALYRMVARIAGASQLPEARAALQEQLEEIQEAGESEDAARLVFWLRGVERFYAPDRKLDRGSKSIGRALVDNALGLGQTQFRIDYARALRHEANLRQARLRSEYVSRAEDRGRRLFRIGWGAAQLGDLRELRVATVRLSEDTGTQRGRAYLPLLRGLTEILSGRENEGERHILEGLRRSPGLLSPREEAVFRDIARTREVPEARDRGGIYVTTGKIWADLEQSEWLDRTQDRLRRELSKPADLAYLSFLEAIDAYRRNEVDVATSKLFELLDSPSYPELSRQEVAGLLVLAEERGKELERIAKRRELALETLRGLKLAENRPEGSQSKIIRWQIEQDKVGSDYILSDVGDKGFEEIDGVLQSSWLEFPLEEKRLELKDDLVTASQQLRETGRLAEAREVLDRSRSLVRDHAVFHREDAAILMAMAHVAAPSEEDAKKDLFRRAGEAYLEAATSSFGFPELYFEATQAFLAAGLYAKAYEAADQYAPTELVGATANARYWDALMHRVRLHRHMQNYSLMERLIEENLDRHESPLHREKLLFERGLALEAQGKTDEALRDYDAVYGGLLAPASHVWQSALFRKANILNDRLQTTDASDGGLPQLEQETLEVWEELAAWMDENSGQGDLAKALHSAGEIRLNRGDYVASRRHFQSLIDLEDTVRAAQRSPMEEHRWTSLIEKSRFSLADSYFQSREYDQASHFYRDAVGRYPNSGNIPYGYFQLGECERHQGNDEQAVNFYELGKRKLDELSDQILEELPPRRGKAFWRSAFQKQIRALDRP